MADPLKENIDQLIAMKFARDDAVAALKENNNDIYKALDALLEKKKESKDADDDLQKAIQKSKETYNQSGPQPMSVTNEDAELSKAIEMSMKGATLDLDEGSLESQLRKDGVPVGLRNIGNSCYFNSFLQAYFMMPRFVEEIMKFVVVEKEAEKAKAPQKMEVGEEKKVVNPEEVKMHQRDTRKKACGNLIKHLQKLFAKLILSNRKYADPTDVLNSVVDDYGSPVIIGDQKDAGEFNNIFLTRLNEGLGFDIIESITQKSSKILSDVSKSPPKLSAVEKTQSPGMSGINLVSAGAIPKSFIYRNFFGVSQYFIRAREKDSSIVEITNEATFSQILVNALVGDIYDGCDVTCFNEIEGYRTPKDYITKAEQESWIIRFPSVLFLQLQRVVYDQEKFALSKIHNPVHFEKVIYLDRYAIENRKQASEIRLRVKQLRKKLKFLDDAKEEFKSYGKNKLNIEAVLNTTVEFLRKGKVSSLKEEDGIRLFSPNNIKSPLFEKGSPELAAATTLLDHLEKEIHVHLEDMEVQYSEIQSQVAHSYDKMRSNPYYLHSILMHAGQAESGHYYSFIYDFEQQIWRRYSDTQIVEVPEEEVFQEAMGERNRMAQAFSLVYLAKESEMLMKPSVGLLRCFSLDKTSIVKAEVDGGKASNNFDYYSTLVPLRICQEIADDNLTLANLHLENQAQEINNKAQREYNKRYARIFELKEQMGGSPAYALMSFVCYLESKKTDFYKWQLLDNILFDLTEGKTRLIDIHKEDKLLTKLNSSFVKQCKNSPANLFLNLAEQQQLDLLKESYLQDVRIDIVLKYILERMLEENFPVAIQGIGALCQLKLSKNHQLYAEYLIKILALRLSTEINKLLAAKDIVGALNCTKAFATFCVTYTGPKDRNVFNICQLIRYSYVCLSPELTAKTMEHDAILTGVEEYSPSLKEKAVSVPDELKKKLIERTDAIQAFNWRESSEKSIDRYAEEFQNKYKTFDKWYKSMTTSDTADLTIEEKAEDEKAMGIVFLDKPAGL